MGRGLQVQRRVYVLVGGHKSRENNEATRNKVLFLLLQKRGEGDDARRQHTLYAFGK